MKKFFLKCFNNNKILFLGMVAVIVIVTIFPYFRSGIYGFRTDLIYHLLRIEGLKESLLNLDYPSRIYYNIFNGYGYGSPMFYPDIFLIIPALFRIVGLSVTLSFKLFALIITIVASITTFYSMKIIIGDYKLSICATMLIMLSQFYLTDLMNRVGLSEYLAYVFIPLLFAGIFDFFAKSGKKVYLIGIALVGLLLSHTIMFFLGVLITVVFMIVGLVVELVKKKFNGVKWLNLIIVGVVSILISSYYWMPLLEQVFNSNLHYTEPWAHIGEYTQPLYTFFLVTGHFNYIAYVGIGIPVLLLIVVRLFIKKTENVWNDVFLLGGIALILCTTRIIPWGILEKTILNSIQFTYRFYPYALCMLSIGVILSLKQLLTDIDSRKIYNRVFVVVSAMAVVFGVWQNYSILSRETNTNLEYAIEEENNLVGEGKEWLPLNSKNPEEYKKDDPVKFDNNNVTTNKEGNRVEFEANQKGEYEVPFVYYKGYYAYKTLSDYSNEELTVEESKNGLVKVVNDSNDGKVVVYYKGTIIQKVSLVISIMTIVVVCIFLFWKKRKNKNGEKDENTTNR